VGKLCPNSQEQVRKGKHSKNDEKGQLPTTEATYLGHSSRALGTWDREHLLSVRLRHVLRVLFKKNTVFYCIFLAGWGKMPIIPTQTK